MRFIGIMTSAVLLVSATASAFDFWLGPNPPAQDLRGLLEAPTILVGEVEALRHRGTTTLQLEGPVEVEVEVLDASITIRQVIRGRDPGKAILVRRLLKASNPYNDTVVQRQIPQARKTYLFFLSPSERDNEFDPVNPTEFAVEVVVLPAYEARGASTENILRRLAKKNVNSTNEWLTARWFGILGEVYSEKEDLQFLLHKAGDPRPHIQGNALAVLCERSPGHPSLYSRAMRFLTGTRQPGMSQLFRRVSKSLPQVVGEDKLTKRVLLDWMSSGVYELSRVGFGIAESRRDRSMAGDIVELMLATKDRKLQYSCIRALAATWRDDRKLPAIRTFMENADYHVKRWSMKPGGADETP